MKLTESQLEDLKSLKTHPGYLLLKKIEDEFLSEFNREIMLDPSFDPSSEETQKKMKEASLYMKARKDIFRQIDNSTLAIVGVN